MAKIKIASRGPYMIYDWEHLDKYHKTYFVETSDGVNLFSTDSLDAANAYVTGRLAADIYNEIARGKYSTARSTKKHPRRKASAKRTVKKRHVARKLSGSLTTVVADINRLTK